MRFCTALRDVNVASELFEDVMERPDLAIRQRAYFRFLKSPEDVEPSIEKVKLLKEVQNPKNRIQFIICCSSCLLCLYDLVENDNISINLSDLPDHYAFLLPMKDGRREKIVSSQEADKKACLKLTRLLDYLAKINNIEPNNMHKLNSFIRRILFCLFAESTGIFSNEKNNMFTNAFNTLVDSSAKNAKQFFEELFFVLSTKPDKRKQYNHPIPAKIMEFPYVNGGIFKEREFIPEFNLAARNQLIDCGRLEWNKISPAIFGAMFQGAMRKDERRNLGAHYTSEENILKIIKPLFLDKLYNEFNKLVEESEKMLQQMYKIPNLAYKRSNKKRVDGYANNVGKTVIKLDNNRKQMFIDFLSKIRKMKFLDPACGCGNFLLIAYRELRILEHKVIQQINKNEGGLLFTESFVNIDQFYGIEIEDWPAEIAHVSMWLMQHLMNQEKNAMFGTNIESIPLKSSATIVTTNALTTDWNTILPAEECSYILGNPPFGGTTYTTAEQKKWLQDVYPPKYRLGYADFVTAWFVKASDYMKANKSIETAFVSTNSICQGEQVNILWGLLFKKGIKINFAYSSFPWKNDAADKAGVSCVIVGFSYNEIENNILNIYDYKTKITKRVKCAYISPYLVSAKKSLSTIVVSSTKELSPIIPLVRGPQPTDGGNLLFDYTIGQKFIKDYPEAKPFLKKFIGSSELMKNEFRYCLWLKEDQKDKWSKIPAIMERVNRCEVWRASQIKTGAAYKVRNVPWRFGQMANPSNPDSALVIPRVTSENRYYMPMDFVKSDTIVNDAAFMLPNATNYDFAILTSRMHMCWMRLTSGRLESRYRYSRDMTFNTFIWPDVTDIQKKEIDNLAKNIRLIRVKYLGKNVSLGNMYLQDKMPDELKEAHNNLDMAVEKAYRKEPFKDDEERLAFLLDLYSEAIAKKEEKK